MNAKTINIYDEMDSAGNEQSIVADVGWDGTTVIRETYTPAGRAGQRYREYEKRFHSPAAAASYLHIKLAYALEHDPNLEDNIRRLVKQEATQ